MLIRKMMIDDYENIYELWMSCAGMGLNNLDDSKDGIGRFLERNPDTCFVAEDNDKIVGKNLKEQIRMEENICNLHPQK